mgnify:FL=1
MGSDFNPSDESLKIATFQSTLPAWGATGISFKMVGVSGFISIHAPRMGSDYKPPAGESGRKISIHAPRMGSDGIT